MSSKYKAREQLQPYFITSTVVRWIDALSRPAYKDILVDSLRYCIGHKGLQLHAWVIMSNHFHLIASAAEDQQMGWIMRDLKKFTSKRLVEAIDGNPEESRRKWMMRYFRWAGENNPSNEIHQFWQHDYHPVLLDTREKRRQRLNYTHNNPVKAGLVREAEHYIYSSAADYYTGQKGLLPLVHLDDYTFL